MTDHIVKACPQCGQQLRFPTEIGGVVMACPTCGNRFNSDFKFGGVRKQKGFFMTLFEIPNKILNRIGRYFSS